jgi:hypothetical protein
MFRGDVCSLVSTVAGFVLDLLPLTPERTGSGGYLVTEETLPLAESIKNTIDEVNALYQEAWGDDSAYSVRIVPTQQGRTPEQYLKDLDETFEDEGCYAPAYTIGRDLRNLYNETEKIREKIRDNNISSVESIKDNLPDIVDNRLYKYSDRNYS